MTTDTEVCKYAEAYIPGESHVYHCNRKKSFIQWLFPFFDCLDKTYIPGIVDNHDKPLPLCKREMCRNSENISKLEVKAVS